MKVVIIDNYDSFTFNLYQYTGEILSRAGNAGSFELLVKRNDEITLAQLRAWQPDRIIISPGPGSAEDAGYFGVCSEVIVELGPRIPLLGVCLGMQGIVHCLGGRIVRAPVPKHGKTSLIVHDGAGVYRSVPQRLEIMRYHSLMVEAATLPDCLTISSIVADGQDPGTDMPAAALRGQEIMGIRHKEFPIEGVQFHPESFATEGGQTLLQNFLFQR